VDYYNLVAQIYYIKQDYDQALEWYDKSAALDALYSPTWLYKGDTHMAKSEVEEAAAAHIQAIELNAPGFIDENYDTRLSFYMNNDHLEPILTALEAFVEAHRPDARQDAVARALWGLGHAQLRLGNTEQANQLLTEAVNRGFNDSRALIELGDTSLTLGKLTEAEAAYNRALEQNPNLPQVHSSLGYIYAQTGRLQEAIEANAAVLQTMPNDYDSNKNLALLYQQAGEPEQAMAYARVALEVAPEDNRADLETFIDQLSSQMLDSPGSEPTPTPETATD
jgi:tetratricopeptide (TPR) repeat protein